MNTELSKLIARMTEIEDRGPISEDKSDKPDFLKDKEDKDKDEKELDESVETENDEDSLEECDASLGECGGRGEITAIPMSSSHSDDSVSMTINMSGSGKGGIHDILDVIRNIENGKDDQSGGGLLSIGGHQLPVGDKEINQDADVIIGTQELEDDLNRNLPNSPHERYSSLRDITASGDDMHKSKDMYSRAQPGDNAMAVKERLESLYHFVKSK